MRQHCADIDLAAVVVDGRDQPELVAADIEDGEPLDFVGTRENPEVAGVARSYVRTCRWGPCPRPCVLMCCYRGRGPLLLPANDFTRVLAGAFRAVPHLLAVHPYALDAARYGE